MILLDNRAGSIDLHQALLAFDIEVDVTRLEFGDLAFMGRGVGGADIFIGIEHKKLPDLVQSLTSDRLAGHQLPGMIQTYDRCYLVIEGEWDVDKNGRVVVPHTWRRNGMQPLKGCPAASVLEQRVITLATRGGLTVRWARNQRESVRYIAALYRYWTDRDLDAHRSHLAMHAPDLDPTLKEKVSDFRYGLNGFVPGLGLARTGAIEAACGGSLDALKAMPVESIADIKVNNRRLGMVKAAHLLEKLR